MRYSAAIALFLLTAEAVLACTCALPDPVRKSRDDADVVFAGVVEKIEHPNRERMRALPLLEQHAAREAAWASGEWGQLVTFRVMQWWKGEKLAPKISLWTGYGGSDCGYPVEIGQSYLIYGERSGTLSQLRFHSCDRNAPLICATDDVEELGIPLKVYEVIDRAKLIAREQPYRAYGVDCITPPLLLERTFRFSSNCYFGLDAHVAVDGRLLINKVIRQAGADCPLLDPEKAAAWRFQPGSIDGQAVAVKVNTLSMFQPATVAEAEARRAKNEKRRNRAAAEP